MTTYVLKIAQNYFSHYTGLKKNIWNGIFLCFAESGFIGVYYFLPIYFTQELGFSISIAGIIISCFGFGTILGGYVGGKLSDIFSPDKVCLVSLFFQAIVFLLLVKLKTVSMLSLDLFLMGFCSYAFITANHLWILERCDEVECIKLKALNILNVASNLALALSAIIMGFFVTSGFSIVFETGSFFLFLLACYFLIFQIKETRVNREEMLVPKPIDGSNSIHLSKVTLLALVSSFLMGFIIFQTSTTYSVYLKDAFPILGFRALSILLTINCFMVVFLQTPLVNILGKYNKISMMGIGAFLIGFGMVILPFSYTFLIAILSCVIYTIGEMSFCSLSQLVCYQSGGNRKKGRVMGLYRMIYASSRVVAPSIGGFIFQHIGGDILWYVCGFLGVLSLILCQYYKNMPISSEV